MQNNTDKDFSDLLKDKLKETSFDYSEDLWDKTFSKYRQERLGNRRRRALGWIGSIAGVAILSAGIAFFGGYTEHNTIAKAGCQPYMNSQLFQADGQTQTDKNISSQTLDENSQAIAPLSAPKKTYNKANTANISDNKNIAERSIAKKTSTPKLKTNKAQEIAEISPAPLVKPVVSENETAGQPAPEYPLITFLSLKPHVLKASAFHITYNSKPGSFKPGDIKLRENTAAAVEAMTAATANQPAASTDVNAENRLNKLRRRLNNDTSIWDRMRLSKNSPYYHPWQIGAEIELNESFRSLSERGNGLDTGYLRLRNKAETPTRTNAIRFSVQYNFNRHIGIGSGIGFVQMGYRANSGKYLIYEYDTLGNPKEKLHNYNARVAYNFINIPLELRISPIACRAFSVTAFAGVNAMWLIKDKGITPSVNDRSPVSLETDEQLVRYNPVHLTASYGFSVNSNLTKNLQLSIQPTWRRSLNSLYASDMPVDERFKSKGLTVGLNYGF